MCPLTRQVMHDPVTIEMGQTFEMGQAILKWFKECRDNGRKPTCPLTQTELRSTEISPSIALRNVIDEWRARNEEKELEKACNSLNLQSEDDTLRALVYISQICQKSGAKKSLVRKEGIIPTIADMLKSSSRRVRLKSLEVLRVVMEDNDENMEELGKGDTISKPDAGGEAGGAPAGHDPRQPARGALHGGRREGAVQGDVRGGAAAGGGGSSVRGVGAGVGPGAALGGAAAADEQRPGRGAAILGHGAGEPVHAVEEPDGRDGRAAACGLHVRLLRRESQSGASACGDVPRARWLLLAAGDVLPGGARVQGGGAAGGVPGARGRSGGGGGAGGGGGGGGGGGPRPVVDVLLENRTEALQRRAMWAAERILRVEDIAQEVAVDQSVTSALVEAYRNGDVRTRQLRHLDRIPNFTAFHHGAGNPATATAKNRQ